MEQYLYAVVASAIVVTGVAVFLGAILLMRNPHNPAWVMNEGFSQAVCLLMTCGFATIVAVAVNGFFLIGFSVIQAFAVTGAIIAVTSFIFCSLTHFAERLKRAELGRSTLERIGHNYHHGGNSPGVV